MSGGGGNIFSAGIGMISGEKQADAAKEAAASQALSANNATQLTGDMYNNNVNMQAPYRNAGYGSLAQLQYLLGMEPTAYGAISNNNGTGNSGPLGLDLRLNQNAQDFLNKGGDADIANDMRNRENAWSATDAARQQAGGGAPTDYSGFAPNGQYGELAQNFGMAQFQQDPGEQFRQDQALKALDRSAAAHGNLLSGGALKGIIDYSQNAASQEYQNAYNRYNNDQTSKFNKYAALAGIGQTATNMSGQLGAQAAGQMGEYGLQAGNANAAGILGQAAGYNNGLTSLGSAVNNYSSWNQLQNMQDQNYTDNMPAAAPTSMSNSYFS
jgi:hypothetical protein